MWKAGLDNFVRFEKGGRNLANAPRKRQISPTFFKFAKNLKYTQVNCLLDFPSTLFIIKLWFIEETGCPPGAYPIDLRMRVLNGWMTFLGGCNNCSFLSRKGDRLPPRGVTQRKACQLSKDE
jgi:hypothetical protein